MKEKWKRIVSFMLAIIMVCSMAVPVSAENVSVNETLGDENTTDALEFSADSVYAIVEKTTGNAVNATASGWTSHIMVQGIYHADTNQIEDKSVRFIITPQDAEEDTLEANQTKVKIECYVGNEVYPFRKESGNNYCFADADKRYDASCEMYIITKTAENEGTIQAVSDKRYATIDNGELRFDEASKADDAAIFTFAQDPTILDISFTIEHVGTGKYIKTYAGEDAALTVNGEAEDEAAKFSKIVFGSNDNNEAGVVYETVSFVSEAYGNGIKTVVWRDAPDASYVLTSAKIAGEGWESIRVIPNGDGTVSFKDSYYDQYITVEEERLACRKLDADTTKDELTDNEKFIIHTKVVPQAVTDLKIDNSSRTETTLDLSWTNPQCIYSDLKLQQKDGIGWNDIADVSGMDSYKAENLKPGTNYEFRLVIANGSGEEQLLAEGNEVSAKTRAGEKPATPSEITLVPNGDDFVITWEACENATEYVLQRAESLFGTYETIDTVTDTTVTVAPQGDNKYANYYRVIAQANNDPDEQSDASNSVSLETTMFGDHTIFFAPTDDPDSVDELLYKLCEKQNDIENDAQFNSEQWQVYFKPGDYTNTSCMYIGFYTSFNGLGKLPTDVKLNNLAVPAYLTELVANGQPNATCNFWRSAENLSIIDTGNEKGKATHWSTNWRPDAFNWGVAQAAPLRRVASERFTAYDDNWGWASGGYVADCLFTGVDDSGNGAGTASGQQFYTRNSEITGNAYGTTINNFFQGVTAANLPTAENYETNYQDTWAPLESGRGYTNWGIASAEGTQQFFTSINDTERISEKPFLFFDESDNEYKIFVPDVEEDTVGVSWGEGKANGGMGEGEILPLSDFYIADPSDSAAEINGQLEAGKNIYFTPGQYHAEVPIEVNKENTILLGTGMTSIIPENKEAAMKVADVGGVRIEALIFDAGEWSEYLLIVGEKGKHTDHADSPNVLQDLFFRVGGTTDKLTKSDYALEINNDDTIGDHFWIWRADHGAGVEWYGNESYHGLIVNGDDVTCYALFNEHFQKYDTLWNGDNGATYFYQNEKCYDPISQDAWMSHKDTVKGYSAYKVANKVKTHYAVGFGMYNVFIYTGPEYDSSTVSIELESAMEVPNRENVRVENACIQTFANDNSALQTFNHIINGVGPGVSSGINENGVKAEGYSRKFLLSYNNGTATYGKKPITAEAGKFIGIETKTDVKQPMNEEGDIDAAALAELGNVVSTAKLYKESNYTQESWTVFAAALETAEAEVEKGEDWAVEEEVLEAVVQLQSAMEQLELKAGVDKDTVDKEILESQKKELNDTIASITSKALNESDYPEDDWTTYQEALQNANTVAAKETVTAEEVSAALVDLNTAAANLEKAGITYQRELLQQEILKAANLQQLDYDEDKWGAYQSALTEARTVFLKEDATLADLKTAKENLKKAYTDLSSDHGTNPGDGSTTNPGDGSTTNPGDGSTTNPGDGSTTNPGDGSTTNPGDGSTNNPGTGNIQQEEQLTVSKVSVAAESRPYGIKTVYLKKKAKLKLKATVTGSEGISTKVTFTSNNKSVASVNSKGQITAGKKTGTAVITAVSVQDPSKKAVITVKVVSKAASNKVLKLKKTKVTLKDKGAAAQIQLKKYTKNTTDAVSYKVTSGKKYVKVDKYGVITCKVKPGKKAAKAKVQVTCGKKKAVVTVTIPKKK